MYFDKLIEKFNGTCKVGYIDSPQIHNFENSILFKVEKLDVPALVDFWKNRHYIEDIGANNIRLPFENMALQIGSDLVLWLTGKNYPEEHRYNICIDYFCPQSLSLLGLFQQKGNPQDITHNEISLDYDANRLFYNIFAGVPASKYKSKDCMWEFRTANPVLGQMVKDAFGVTIFYLFLLNCRNIKKKLNIPSKILQRSRKKKGRLPLVSYYTLELDIEKKPTQNSNNKKEPIEHNRIHLCRGHFKEYTEDNPLFGKYTGLWWWQPSVRGQNKKGIIVKDYELKP